MSNLKFFEIISKVVNPLYKFLRSNIYEIRSFAFDTNTAVIIFSVLIAICIIKNDVAFALTVFASYILFYTLIINI